jgi:hypothetical protein
MFSLCCLYQAQTNSESLTQEVCLQLKSSGMIQCVCVLLVWAASGAHEDGCRSVNFSVSKRPCCIPSIPPKLLQCLKAVCN